MGKANVNGFDIIPDEKQDQGLVIGVDLLTIHPLPGATLMGGQDFTLPKTQQLILDVLQGRKVLYNSL